VPTFSPSLEKALHQALTYANERHHEYATLEHLLLALVDDADAAAVMGACNVDLDALRKTLSEYVDNELSNLITGYDEDSKPTSGFQRVIQRAVIHVQSSGREEVTGANVLVGIFSERESHAAFFLQEQGMTRFDAVNYIGLGITKREEKQQIHAQTVDDCLDILEAAFQSPMWEQLPQQERIRLVGRLSHIMEIVERRDLEE